MKSARIALITLSIAAATAGSAFAADGTMPIANGEIGSTMQVKKQQMQDTRMGKSRAEVATELRNARANGTLIDNGEIGSTLQVKKQLMENTGMNKSRADVVGELRNAEADGTLMANGELGNLQRFN
jgi:light-regulated signal transduction histidine kinase (bacteriophytochrome)